MDDSAPIYDVVPEDEFNTIAKKMMLEDDFVVDDNGEGYAQGGLEDWDTRYPSDLDEEEEEMEETSKKTLCPDHSI